jgi:hypothetical protein
LLYDPSLDPSAFSVSATSATAVLAVPCMHGVLWCSPNVVTNLAVAV